jgi:hypothetical protein
MKPNLLVGLRLDCSSLSTELAMRFQLIPFPPSAPETLQHFHAPSTVVMGVDVAQFVHNNWNSVTAAIAATHTLIDQHKPVGCVLWNTVQPQMAAVALTCRKRKVPVFEINHWAISTYLVGHFEDSPLADAVYCSKEYANFVGVDVPVRMFGRPQYDKWETEERHIARQKIGIPVEGPYVLVTTTWSHYLTEWSGSEWNVLHQEEVITLLSALQRRVPGLKVIYTSRFPNTAQSISARLGEAGLVAHVTDDTHIMDLINAADVVVCQKSGVIADSLCLGRPVICVDYRPQVDYPQWKRFGARLARNKRQIARQIVMFLTKPRAVERLESLTGDARDWFGWQPGCSKTIAEDIEKLCQNS